MKATELRVGNLIDYEHTTHVVTEISENTIQSEWLKDRHDSYMDDISEYSGVPLTEEWLVRVGFEKGYNLDEEEVFGFEGDGSIIIERMMFGSDLEPEVDFYMTRFDDFQMDVHIDFVHQLQNLYFALSGEELELIDSTKKCSK